MPTTLNKVTLLGHVGTEPEIHHFEKELTLCKFRLATNDFFTEKSTGEKKELTDWHTIISWGEQAKQIQSKLKKKNYLIQVKEFHHNQAHFLNLTQPI